MVWHNNLVNNGVKQGLMLSNFRSWQSFSARYLQSDLYEPIDTSLCLLNAYILFTKKLKKIN